MKTQINITSLFKKKGGGMMTTCLFQSDFKKRGEGCWDCICKKLKWAHDCKGKINRPLSYSLVVLVQNLAQGKKGWGWRRGRHWCKVTSTHWKACFSVQMCSSPGVLNYHMHDDNSKRWREKWSWLISPLRHSGKMSTRLASVQNICSPSELLDCSVSWKLHFAARFKI